MQFYTKKNLTLDKTIYNDLIFLTYIIKDRKKRQQPTVITALITSYCLDTTITFHSVNHKVYSVPLVYDNNILESYHSLCLL